MEELLTWKGYAEIGPEPFRRDGNILIRAFPCLMAHQYEKTDADTNNNILSPLWNTQYFSRQHVAVISKI